MKEELNTVLQLFRAVPLENLSELYKRMRENLSPKQRHAVLATIGARLVYGDEYAPCKHV